jgi:hypothetical protein
LKTFASLLLPNYINYPILSQRLTGAVVPLHKNRSSISFPCPSISSYPTQLQQITTMPPKLKAWQIAQAGFDALKAGGSAPPKKNTKTSKGGGGKGKGKGRSIATKARRKISINQPFTVKRGPRFRPTGK